MNDTAVLWIRVSSEPQSHGYSLETQEDLVQKAAEKLQVVETFRVTESAKTSEKRRQFKEMVEYVKANSVGHIVAYKVDRLGRYYKDFATLQSLVDDNDVTITIVGDGKKVNKESTGVDRFLFQMLGALAEMDNKNRADATRIGMDKIARSGGVPRKPPTGYLSVADPADSFGRRRLVVVDPVRGPLVTQAFELYAQGTYSLSTLCDEMNRQGLTTRPAPKGQGHSMTVPNLHKLLKNPFFYGEHLWRGQLQRGNYEPLITRELYDRVQELLDEHRSYIRPAAKKWFAFKPFLRCGYCGCAITAEEQQGKNGHGRYIYYHCSSGRKASDHEWYKKKFGTKYCIQKRWTEVEVDQLITEELGRLYIDDVLSAKIKERLKTIHVKEEGVEKRESRRLEAERTRRKTHLKLSYLDRLDGRISLEQYEQVQAEAHAELHRIELEIKKLSNRNFKYKEQGSEIIELLRGFKDVYLAADLEGKSKILSVLLKQAILLKDGGTFIWHEPFGILFCVGGFIKKNIREW